jgi:hypothetical protein
MGNKLLASWVCILLATSPVYPLEMPAGLGELLGGMRQTSARVASRGEEGAKTRSTRGRLPACEDHAVKDFFGIERPASSLKYVSELERAVADARHASPEAAVQALEKLDRSGETSAHLGRALLLTLRGRGFVPEEAAYCDIPAAGDKPARKWIGVTTVDGSRFFLDLSRAAAKGSGLAFSGWRGTELKGTVYGEGLDEYLGLRRDARTAGVVLGQILSNFIRTEAGSPALYRDDRTAKYRPTVDKYAKKYGVDPNLAHAVMRREDPWGLPGITSPAGAVGMMQLMPNTARRFGVDPYSADDNIKGGVQYLKFLQDKFGGKLPLVVAAYNAGEGAVEDAGRIPNYRETVFYVAHVLNEYYWLSGRKVDFEPYMSETAGAWVRGVRAW